jgi:hypothetical protein
MTTKWTKRGQAIRQAVPNLAVLAPGKVNSAVPGPGKPVPGGYRGTEYAPRNPMHDTEQFVEDKSSDPIRAQLAQRGVK